MKTLYIDCTAGISGNRLIGALLDLKGENADEFDRRMSWLRRYGCTWVVSAGPNGWGGIEAKPVSSGCETFEFAEIEALLDESKLSPEMKQRAFSAFNDLKTAGCVFRSDESGAPLLDACLVFEIVGALALLDTLQVDSVYASPVNVGGRISGPERSVVSAPVSFFLKGMTVFAREGEHERTTLSGALLLKALSASSESLPAGRLLAGGCGGTAPQGSSEALHVMVLERNDEASLPYLTGKIVVMETNIDDMNPQDYQNLEERLFACGALDVFFYSHIDEKNASGGEADVRFPRRRQRKTERNHSEIQHDDRPALERSQPHDAEAPDPEIREFRRPGVDETVTLGR